MNELELRKRANVYHNEHLEWMIGFKFWVFIFIIIQVLSLAFWWIGIGGIGTGIWILHLIDKGIKAKKLNIEENNNVIYGKTKM